MNTASRLIAASVIGWIVGSSANVLAQSQTIPREEDQFREDEEELQDQRAMQGMPADDQPSQAQLQREDPIITRDVWLSEQQAQELSRAASGAAISLTDAVQAAQPYCQGRIVSARFTPTLPGPVRPIAGEGAGNVNTDTLNTGTGFASAGPACIVSCLGEGVLYNNFVVDGRTGTIQGELPPSETIGNAQHGTVLEPDGARQSTGTSVMTLTDAIASVEQVYGIRPAEVYLEHRMLNVELGAGSPQTEVPMYPPVEMTERPAFVVYGVTPEGRGVMQAIVDATSGQIVEARSTAVTSYAAAQTPHIHTESLAMRSDPSFVQQQPMVSQPPVQRQFVESQPMQRQYVETQPMYGRTMAQPFAWYKLNDLLKMELGPERDQVGEVENAIIDVPAGRLAFMVFSLENIDGIDRHRLYPIPLSAFNLTHFQEDFTLPIPRERLVYAPSFHKDNWTVLNDQNFAAEVYEFYNQAPYWHAGHFHEPAGAVQMSPAYGAQLIRGKQLLGRDVHDERNEKIGELEDVALDPVSGQILYGVVEADSFLGLGNDLTAVPWELLRIPGDEGDLELLVNRSTFESAPTFKDDTWPNMTDPGWSHSIYQHFGYDLERRSRVGSGY